MNDARRIGFICGRCWWHLLLQGLDDVLNESPKDAIKEDTFLIIEIFVIIESIKKSRPDEDQIE